MMPEIEIRNLRFGYPGERKAAMRIKDLEIGKGVRVLVYGPSGQGKSTFLKALCGLVPLATGGSFGGRVKVSGKDTREGITAPDAVYMWQDPEAQCVMTKVWSEIAFGAYNTGDQPFSPNPEVKGASAKVGAEHLLNRDIITLSGGELQRVVLASNLNQSAKVMLLDEPCSQIDPLGTNKFYRALGKRKEETILITDHELERGARFASRALEVKNGRVRWRKISEAVEYERRLSGPVPGPEISGGTEIRIKGLDFRYGGRAVLDGVREDLGPGISLVQGANGSGKTTLGKCICGILRPDRGKIIPGSGAMLLQDTRYYFCQPTVGQDLKLQADLHGAVGKRVKKIINELDIRAVLGRDAWSVSVGQRVRSAIALLLISEPEVLVLDEPTRGMDIGHKRELCKLLVSLAERGANIIITTNDPGLDKLMPFAHKYRLKKGRLEGEHG